MIFSRRLMLKKVLEARKIGFKVGNNINYYNTASPIKAVYLFRKNYAFETLKGEISYSPPMEGVKYPCIGVKFEYNGTDFLYPIHKLELY